MGYKATSILAGLGVGGVAIALAAQKSIENLIGAVTLYISAPVRVGDFGRFGDKMGVVEEIGLRYTRIRSLDRTLISISNSQFADLQIENFTKRDKVRFFPKIRLSRSTNQDQLHQILDEIKQILLDHSKVDSQPVRVRFTQVGEQSYDIDLLAYILTTDYNKYLEVVEELNLSIFNCIEKAGTSQAVPTREVWMMK